MQETFDLGEQHISSAVPNAPVDASAREQKRSAPSELRKLPLSSHLQESGTVHGASAIHKPTTKISGSATDPQQLQPTLPSNPPTASPDGGAGLVQSVFFEQGSISASKQTVGSTSVVGAALLLGLGFYWPREHRKQVVEEDRSVLLDNARVFAQFLVIYMHLVYYNLVPAWSTQIAGYDDWRNWLYGSSELLKLLLDGLSAVTIPMLCFISGVLSQGPTTEIRLRRFVQNLVLPAVLWLHVGKPIILETMMDPRPHAFFERLQAFWRFQSFHEEWYLEALVLWRASVFLLWSHLRPSVALFAMLGLSSFAGYLNLSGPLWYLKLDNAFGFLPHFAVGYVFPFELVCHATDRLHIPAIVAGGLVLVWVFAIIPLAGPLPDGHGNYDCCTAGATFRSVQSFDYALYWTRRLARIACELPPTLMLFFYVIPRRATLLSWIGPHTLYPYLFHQVANHWRNRIVQRMQPPTLTSTTCHVAVLLLHAPYVVMLLVFFASKPWRIMFSWCFEPTWFLPLLKKEQCQHIEAQDSLDLGHSEIAKPQPVQSSADIASDAMAKPCNPEPTVTAAALAKLEASYPSGSSDQHPASMRRQKSAPEDDATSVGSIPEVQPSRPAHKRWQTTGSEIPWQCHARKCYPWLLVIFLGILTSAGLPFLFAMFYIPGWEVLLHIIEQIPVVVAVAVLFISLAGTSATYLWHYFRLHATDRLPAALTADPLTHAVVICAYKEPLDVLFRTLDSIASQQMRTARRPIVVFAAESRDDTAQDVFAVLEKRVGDQLDLFLLTMHTLADGETIGKSSNENWAVRELYKLLVEEQARDPFEVLVTIVDADSVLSSTYLAHLEASFRSQRDGRRLIYSGPLNVYRNFSDAGILTQCYELNRCHADTFHSPFTQYQPQSNYSLSLGFAQELGFWTPDVMPEDIHTANKAMVNNFGSRTTVAIPAIICNDLVVQFGDRYTQAKRHQMGSITEFAWSLALLFHSKLSFPAWWAVFKVEAGRDGSFLDIARSIAGYGCKITVTYLISAHWSSLHWKFQLFLGFYASSVVWGWLWFWFAEFVFWQTLLAQFPIKKPTHGRWLVIVITMPLLLLLGEIIFYLTATIHCLLRITFIGELSYVCAPKGDTTTPQTNLAEEPALIASHDSTNAESGSPFTSQTMKGSTDEFRNEQSAHVAPRSDLQVVD